MLTCVSKMFNQDNYKLEYQGLIFIGKIDFSKSYFWLNIFLEDQLMGSVRADLANRDQLVAMTNNKYQYNFKSDQLLDAILWAINN